MSDLRVLKLGTRRSLLAWAQSGWVAREIERLNPGVRVERVGIDTRGDKILDVPLQAVAGKEFFVAELDEALLSGQVDLTVHSLKDLSLERPENLTLGAIPKRENPRDAALFGPGILDALREGRKIRIGTSSPRRIENIPEFLRRALPRLRDPGFEPDIEFVEIRGNVNTRMSRLQESPGTVRFLDGVILAFAGLARLWADESARSEVSSLFRNLRWMVLPIRECPTAPGQGALAVECRRTDSEARSIIGRLQDPCAARQIALERKLLADWGGGCHQKFGATVLDMPGVGSILHLRGRKPDGGFVEEIRWSTPQPRPTGAVAWDGSKAQLPALGLTSPASIPDLSGKAVFVASGRALPEGAVEKARDARIWCSGTQTWFKMASRGLWIEGASESYGFESLKSTFGDPVVGLPPLAEWVVLTHEHATQGWIGQVGATIATYRIDGRPDALPEEVRRQAREATHFWWNSGSQFEALRPLVPREAVHACGPGKTFETLQSRGIHPLVFPDVQEWRDWLGLGDVPRGCDEDRGLARIRGGTK